MQKIKILSCAILVSGIIFLSACVEHVYADGEGFLSEAVCKSNCDEKGTGHCVKRVAEAAWDCKPLSGQSGGGTTTFPIEGGGNQATTPTRTINLQFPTTSSSGSTSLGAGGGCEAGFTTEGGVCVPGNTGLPSASVDQIIKNLLFWLLAMFSTVAIIAFLISGIQYLISAGEEKMMETAKRNMVYSIIGVLVGLLGLVIIRAIEALLGARTLI